jgi:hypothetical protein
MTRNEMIRFRRDMHRRIQAVVAERRLARRGTPSDDDQPAAAGTDEHSHRDEESLVGG